MKTNYTEVLEELSKPFESHELEWRVQSAILRDGKHKVLMVPYIDARAVMNRLDRVLGPLWKVEYEQIKVQNTEGMQATISIKIGDEWIPRNDGAGVTEFENIKGAYSSALKRAAVLWGIGRYLYDFDGQWCELKTRGEIYVSGKFKVNGQQEYLKGYVDRPKDLKPKGNPSGNHANKISNQSSNSNSQRTSQPQQVNSNSQHPSNQSEPTPLNIVIGILQNLNVPIRYVSGLLKRAGANSQSLEAATVEELRAIVQGIHFTNKYIEHCRSLGMGEQESLYHAQLTMCFEVKEVSALFFKMDKELMLKAIAYVNDLKNQTA